MTLTVYRGERTESDARDALNAAKAEILRIEREFSVTEPNSEISRLNRGETVSHASDDLIAMLSVTRELFHATDGAYDITVYPLVEAWGFTSDEQRVPSYDTIEKALAAIDHGKITVTENGSGGYSVSANGARLDLGSIAKGYACQRATELIRSLGFDSAVLSLGGNAQILGVKPDGAPFRIGIADPAEPDSIALTLTCNDELLSLFPDNGGAAPRTLAIVTSGTYQRYFEKDGVKYHHLLDTSTGYPCDNGLVSVTVICPDGTLADGLSSSLFLVGYDEAIRLYDELGGFEAIFITSSGERLYTPGLSRLGSVS